MRPLDAVRATECALAAAGVPEPRTDAEFLVAHVLGASRTELYCGNDVRDAAFEELRPLLRRRLAREPLQYILGEWGFRRLSLVVDERVLAPRPETEILVDRCLELLHGKREPRILDVGVGSGAIALALADEHGGACVTGVDSSADAIEVAHENARRTGLDDRVALVLVDARAGIDGLRGPFDLVVSNPPYVRAEELDALEPEVRDWEPRSALAADGLTEAVARAALRVLRPGGSIALECGDGQARDVVGLLESLRYAQIVVTRDLGGAERLVDARFNA